jgi:hypothetical protein
MSLWLSRSTAIAAALAALALVVVVAIVTGLWAAIGASDISVAGWLAMILGVAAMLAVGIGLMSLVFYSSRHGYDEDTDLRR